MSKNPFRYFKTSPEIIQLGVMLCVRFPLSLSNVEDLIHERGIIPFEDEQALRQMGVRRVYTSKDFKITQIMDDVVDAAAAAWLVEA